MPYFKNTEEMYEIYQAFFERLASDPDIGKALTSSKLVVQFKVHYPAGLITIDCRGNLQDDGKFISCILGETNLVPDLTFTCSSDFSHEFWHGKVNIVSALLSGKAKAEGNLTQSMKLLPLLKPVYELYPQILKELGREDLIVR